MEDLQYFYGEPIELDNIGIIYPTTVYDFNKDPNLFNVLFLQVNHLSQSTELEEKERRKWIQTNLKNWDIICSNPFYFFQLIVLISKIMRIENLETIKSNFEMVFTEISKDKERLTDEDILEIGTRVFIEIKDNMCISRESYDYFRNEIIKMNAIKFPRVGKTKASQEQFDKEYQNKNKQSKENYADMMSTIGVEVKRLPNELKEMTLYQAHLYFARINKKYKYKTDISFLCAGAKDIEVEHIGSHIDLLETEELMEKGTMDKFVGKYNKLLNRQA